MKRATYIEVTIPANGTKSAAVNIANLRVWGIEFPSAFDGTSPSVSFETAEAEVATLTKPDDASFLPVSDQAGGSLSVTVQTGKVVAIDPSSALSNFLQHAGWIKLVASATQNAERKLVLHGTLDAS